MNILIVFGTRPEIIKLMPVVEALRAFPDVSLSLCHTGQHRELAQPLLDFFHLHPDHDLDIMVRNQSLQETAARCLVGMKGVLEQDRPELVLVQGDTTTALAAAIAGFYARVPVAHLEAGLRSHTLDQPFPEEMNRSLISHLTSLHFAPTRDAVKNLRREGIRKGVYCVGNTSVDAAMLTASRLSGSGTTPLPSAIPPLDANRPLILATVHRRESFGLPLRNICAAIRRLVRAEKAQVCLPVHPNPKVYRAIHRELGNAPHIHLLAPLNYPDLVALLSRARLVLTDSGGIQEEAPSFRVPVVVLREVTERSEGVRLGFASLAGTDPDVIVRQAHAWLTGQRHVPARAASPYGDGRTGHRVARLVRSFVLKHTPSPPSPRR